jgi:hypothetical protein
MAYVNQGLARLLTVLFYLKMIASDRDFAYTYSAEKGKSSNYSIFSKEENYSGVPIRSSLHT